MINKLTACAFADASESLTVVLHKYRLNNSRSPPTFFFGHQSCNMQRLSFATLNIAKLCRPTCIAGGITVSRSDSSLGDSGGYTWTISFPLSARNAPELGFDGAALEGAGAAGSIVEAQAARVPEIQRVSTVAGSEVYGGFTLMLFDEETELLPHNATAEEARATALGMA